MSSDRSTIESFVARFREQKQTVEKAIGQISDAQLHQPLDENTNSVAVIMKHVSGNFLSRFTDFLTSDGEKPGRNRDSEFVDDMADRATIMVRWETGWECLFDSLFSLNDQDLERTITIRGQPHSVMDALIRSLSHSGYHVGQIVQLSRYQAKGNWQVLTIPRGGSKQFNLSMSEKFPDRS
jgi:Protein of unknown function (DUF1572)